MDFSCSMLVKLLIFQEGTSMACNQKFFILLFKHKSKRKKFLILSRYKEAKFSKLKYFLIIIAKCFFSFYNNFSYTQPVYFFYFLREFFNIQDQIIAIFIFLY